MKQLKNKTLALILLLLFSFSGLVAGTQSVASRCNYDIRLGAPLLVVGSYKLYSPSKLFSWGRVPRDRSTPKRTGYILLISGISLGFLAALIVRSFGDKAGLVQNVFGDAAFAKPTDIKRMGLLGRARGVFLGKTASGEYLRHDGPEHYAVIAPTRSGKGAGIVVPTLLSWPGSCLIYDLKGENFQVTAGHRSTFSDVIYFNPNSLDTHRFNPLFEIRQGIMEVRDAQNLATMIIEPDRPGLQDHWVRTGNSLLTAAILHVLYAAPIGEKNLAGVASLLSRPDKDLTETLQEMLETKHLRDENGVPVQTHPGVVAAARDVLNKSPDDRSSVVSTVQGYLSIYRDPLLANATRTSDFTVDSLVNSGRPKSLYIIIPASDIDRLRPLIRVMVSLICRRLTEAPVTGKLRDQEHGHKLLLMLDEFTKLGRLEFFESALGFLAGYGIKAMLVTQSLSDLKQTYGERSSLLDNTHVKVFFRPETLETAEYISKNLGQSTVEYRTRGESGKKGAPFFSNVNEGSHITGRPLLTPREVLELPDDDALIFIGGRKSIRAKKIVYHKDDLFQPLLKPAKKPERNATTALTSVWAEDRFSPPEDFSSREEAVDEFLEPTSEDLVVTGERVKLKHPAKTEVANSDDEADDDEEDLA